MNHRDQLQAWAAEWFVHQAVASKPPPQPVAPPPEAPSTGVHLTVGMGFSPAGMLLRQLDAAIVPDDAQRAMEAGLNLVRAAGTAPAVALHRGEIRQLNPDLKPNWSRPIHVLILTVDETQQRVLAIPFGPLRKPAFESELATGIEDESLAVLAIWNAAWMTREQGARSWVVAQAEESLVNDVETLRKTLANREPLPSFLAERTGPPLLHPTDPRHAYVDEEEGILEELNDEF